MPPGRPDRGGDDHDDDDDDADNDDDSLASTDHSSFAYDEPHEFWDKFGNLSGCVCWACAVFVGIDFLSIMRVNQSEGVMICEQDPWLLTSEPEFIQGFSTIFGDFVIHSHLALCDIAWGEDRGNPMYSLPESLRLCGTHCRHQAPPPSLTIGTCATDASGQSTNTGLIRY